MVYGNNFYGENDMRNTSTLFDQNADSVDVCKLHRDFTLTSATTYSMNLPLSILNLHYFALSTVHIVVDLITHNSGNVARANNSCAFAPLFNRWCLFSKHFRIKYNLF